MLLDLADYETKARSSVKVFWTGRKKAETKQRAQAVNGFIEMIVDIVRANGLPDADIKCKRRPVTLPGHFFPIKSWDLLVMNQGKLIAAIAVESPAGPLIGKHMRSSCEQALNRAIEFQAAFSRWGFGTIRRPFAGYLILLEDATTSRKPVTDVSPNFPLFPEFRGASYAERYNILCKKLMMEQIYTVATVILSPRSASKSGAYSEMSDMTGLKSFVTTLAGLVAAEAAMR